MGSGDGDARMHVWGLGTQEREIGYMGKEHQGCRKIEMQRLRKNIETLYNHLSFFFPFSVFPFPLELHHTKERLMQNQIPLNSSTGGISVFSVVST